MKKYTYIFLLLCSGLFAQQPNPPGQVAASGKAVNEAYLFAYMTHDAMAGCTIL